MIVCDKKGVIRFKVNRIVRDVYDHHYDLNAITTRYYQGKYTPEERFQFLTLLGYSVEGWNELLFQDQKLFPDKEKD